MAKARSPQYPAIGLKQAIEKIKMVYDNDVQNKVTREVVARHAGYNSLNGKALAMLSALGKYGLLDGRGDETYVSDLALEIIAHPTGSPERAAAIGEAAFKPHLFSDIREQFKNGKASDDAIRAYLLKKKFLPSAVHTVIRSYCDTLELVSHESADYDSLEEEQEEPSEGMVAVTPALNSDERLPTQGKARHIPLSRPGERTLFSYNFEPSGSLRLVVDASVDVEQALHVVETLVKVKREELKLIGELAATRRSESEPE